MYRPESADKPNSAHRPATLEALSWAAENAGMSYGRFVLNLTDEDKACIQLKFEQYRKNTAKADAEHKAERSPTDATVTEKGWRAYAELTWKGREEATLLNKEDTGYDGTSETEYDGLTTPKE